jgi:hypothetical protein
MTRFWLAASASGAAFLASPAAAQGIIPDAIEATIAGMSGPARPDPKCVSGETLPSDEEVAEARTGAEAAMKTYIALAGAARGADASAAFVPRSRLRGWERADSKSRMVDRVDDPLARALAAGEARVEPLRFFRAGQGRTAIGEWLVRTSEGAPLGSYWVWFHPEDSVWKITRLDFLVEPARPTQQTSRYCLMPGDVDPHPAALERREAKRAKGRPGG